MADVLRQPVGARQDRPEALAAGVDGARAELLIRGAWSGGSENATQHLTRTEYDGTITVLAHSFEGKRLTGPNDVVVKSDNSIWFSDNGAGTRGNYLGHTLPQELPFRVYRLDPATGQMTIAVGDRKRPNGRCLSPEEKTLYTNSTPATRPRTSPVHE